MNKTFEIAKNQILACSRVEGASRNCTRSTGIISTAHGKSFVLKMGHHKGEKFKEWVVTAQKSFAPSGLL